MLSGRKLWRSFIVSSLVIAPLSLVKFPLSSDLSSFDAGMSPGLIKVSLDKSTYVIDMTMASYITNTYTHLYAYNAHDYTITISYIKL